MTWEEYVGQFITVEKRIEIGVVGDWISPYPEADEQNWLDRLADGEVPCSFAYTGNCSGNTVMIKIAATLSWFYCQEHYRRKVAADV